MPDFDVIKQNFISIIDMLTDKEYLKNLLHKVNPSPLKDADFFVDYIIRVLLFLFPLYVYENNAIMGISGKEIIIGIVVLSVVMYCVPKLFWTGELKEKKTGLSGLIILGIFVIVALIFVFQISHAGSEAARTYRYLGLFLLPFCVQYAGDFRRYYFQLLTASFTILYISMYRFVFTGLPTMLGADLILSDQSKLIPFLMLGIAASSILYITEEKIIFQRIYLVITAASMVLIFLYGDMTAFIIMFLFITGLQFISLPTVSFMKKNMILLFLFGFCASNAPLLTYFKTPGISREFDLEYSIYIDLVIAVAGLFITKYWERIPEKQSEGPVLMPVFSKWYKRFLLIIISIILAFILLGSRGEKLQNVVGGKVLSGFSTAFWESVSRSDGELWHIISVYGIIGLGVVILVGIMLVRLAARAFQNDKLTVDEKGLILLVLLFAVQSFFYPFSVASTPQFLIFTGFALHADRLGYAGSFSNHKTEKITRFVPGTVFLLSSAMAAALALLVVFAVYRLFMPVGNAGDTSSMVQNAIEVHQGQAQEFEQEDNPLNGDE